MSSVVEFYSRSACPLCDQARRVVQRECAAAGATWQEIDVDSDPYLQRTYGELVPVVVVDDHQVGYWRIDAARLRTALGMTPPRRGTGAERAPGRRWFRRKPRG